MLQKEEGAFERGPRWPKHGGKSAKGPEKRGQQLKASRYDYNQEKNQSSNPKSQDVLLKA